MGPLAMSLASRVTTLRTSSNAKSVFRHVDRVKRHTGRSTPARMCPERCCVKSLCVGRGLEFEVQTVRGGDTEVAGDWVWYLEVSRRRGASQARHRPRGVSD